MLTFNKKPSELRQQQIKYRRTVLIATLGTVLEWAEFMFFAYMADLLSTLFFPIQDPQVARLKTYGIFAISYLMRPLGAILFGHIGDRYGRKPALVGSLMLMAFSSIGIGLLPAYSTLGIAAPISLLFLRLIQGLAVSGEMQGASILLLEHVGEKRPFLAGAWAPFAAAMGMVLGALCSSLVTLSSAPDWAWRVPFLASAIACILGLLLRQKVLESPQYRQSKRTQKILNSPLLTVLKIHKKALLCTAAINFFICAFVYIGNVYYKTLLVNVGGLPASTAAQIVTFGEFMAALGILYFGFKADKWGGRLLCFWGMSLAFFLSPVIIYTATTGSIAYALLGQMLFALCNGLTCCSALTLLIKLFKTETRYTGSALAWNISAALFGGSSLLIAEYLIQQQWLLGPGYYISFAALVGLWALSHYAPYDNKTLAKITPIHASAS